MVDEKSIIQQCLAGNTNAFSRLVSHYQRLVIALAMNITGDPDEARDVAQETFIQAYANLNRFDLNKIFKNWLMGIAAKRSIDRLRKKKSFLKFMKHYMSVTKTKEKSNTTMIEDSLSIKPLIKKLKAKERAVLYLAVMESYTAKEIGSMLHCSENTVRVHLYNSRKKIKRDLLNNPTFNGNYEVVK